MIEELKIALFNLYHTDASGSLLFSFSDSDVELLYGSILLSASEESITVSYTDNFELSMVCRTISYLNKENTVRKFTSVQPAIEYFKYLIKAIDSIQYEVYIYFLYEFKKLNFKSFKVNFYLTNNSSDRDIILNCSLSQLEINSLKTNYNIQISIRKGAVCQLSFHPLSALWSEGKVIPSNNVNEILHYLSNLDTSSYEAIPLNETMT